MKDVERIASKQKGVGKDVADEDLDVIIVVEKAVKDVLQSLVDDGLVKCEKIGTSNYFWSYPGDAHQAVSLDDAGIPV